MINLKIVFISLILLFLASHKSFSLKNDIHITANSFEYDTIFDKILAKQKVKITDNDIIIQGEEAIYDRKKTIFELNGNIKIVKDDLYIYCNKLKASKTTETISAQEKVKIKFKNIKGKANKATYFYNFKNMIILEGKPIAWRNNDKITGEKIIIDLNKNKIRTEGNAKFIISKESLKGKNIE